MQPARKLLGLLVLVLMGTELTQVRASNAIFLRACQAPARPPGEPGKVGEQLRAAGAPCPDARAPRLGWREVGCRRTETGAELLRTPSPGPAGAAQRAPYSPPRSSSGTGGPPAVVVI